VPTSPLSSFYMANKVAEALKSEIRGGKFFLTQPVDRLPTDTVCKPMKETKELPPVKDVMIREVATISESASIADAAKLMMESQITHIPVISEKGILEGIVTAWDISTAVATRHEGLAEIMTRNVITADSEEPLELVIRKLERYNISALPVIDRDRRVTGMITSDGISRLIGKERRWRWKLRL
jgi:CBS domain-containing protein